MKILLFANLRLAAGRSEINASLREPRDLIEVLTEVAEPLGEKFRSTLFDGDASLSRDVVVCLNERMVERGQRVTVQDSDEVSLLMPLAGGSAAPMRNVASDTTLCTGCGLCLLACSMEHVDGVNPRYSWVKVQTDLMGVPLSIYFTHGCDRAHGTQCRCRGGIPSCVAVCEPRALTYLSEGRVLSS